MKKTKTRKMSVADQKRIDASNAINLDDIDLQAFLMREDVLNRVGHALFPFVSKIRNQTIVRDDEFGIYFFKERFVDWDRTTSLGCDYGSGFMKMQVFMAQNYRQREESSDIYRARLYFDSYDDSDWSIDSDQLQYDDCIKIYKKLDDLFRMIRVVPSQSEAEAIARKVGCYLSS
jgi:hypothetical protein